MTRCSAGKGWDQATVVVVGVPKVQPDPAAVMQGQGRTFCFHIPEIPKLSCRHYALHDRL